MQKDAARMLTLKMVEGNYDGLKDMNSILLSASTAKAFFGNEDPLNKVIRIDNNANVKVTGVYEDIPYNTINLCLLHHLNYMLLINRGFKEQRINGTIIHSSFLYR